MKALFIPKHNKDIGKGLYNKILKDKYIYLTIFRVAEKDGYWIEFPDLPMANTQGEDLKDDLFMAEKKEEISKPTIPYTDTSELENGGFIQLSRSLYSYL